MSYRDALRFLDEHLNLERLLAPRNDPPTLDRMRRLMDVIGEPQHAAPVVHITGTNGKGSTAQIVTKLLMAQGLTVGTYASPHLERVNERLLLNGEPISDDEFAAQIAAVADLEVLAGVRPTWFEALTAAAFRWFADLAVDVVVLEVGLLGRWDATNVADANVAVVTNIGVDHLEYAGPTRAHVAAEKAGIVKPASTLVLGETEEDLATIFRRAGAAHVFERELDFGVIDNTLALGGRSLRLRTPLAAYEELFLPLHGAHQGDNAVIALTAVESFFDAPLSPDVIEEGFADVRMPGRFEVVGHQPLVILDGAHNPAGALACSQTLEDDFEPAGDRLYVVGMLRGRDPEEMLSALGAEQGRVLVACAPQSPRAMSAEEVAKAAESLGVSEVYVVDSVPRAVDRGIGLANPDDAVLISGSLYVVGEARAKLVNK